MADLVGPSNQKRKQKKENIDPHNTRNPTGDKIHYPRREETSEITVVCHLIKKMSWKTRKGIKNRQWFTQRTLEVS